MLSLVNCILVWSLTIIFYHIWKFNFNKSFLFLFSCYFKIYLFSVWLVYYLDVLLWKGMQCDHCFFFNSSDSHGENLCDFGSVCPKISSAIISNNHQYLQSPLYMNLYNLLAPSHLRTSPLHLRFLFHNLQYRWILTFWSLRIKVNFYALTRLYT